MNNNNKLMFSIPTKSSSHHLAGILAYPLHNELETPLRIAQDELPALS